MATNFSSINGSCDYYFFENDAALDDFKEKTIYFMLVPSAVIFAVVAFLQTRKFLWPSFLGGRPSVPVPLNIIQNKEDRISLVAGFCLTSWTLLDVIFGGTDFSWQYPTIIKSLMVLLSCLIYGFFYYPIFGAFTLKNPVSYILGTFYVWILAVLFFITQLPCKNLTAHFKVVHIFKILPGYILATFISISMPLRAIKEVFNRRTFTGKFLEDYKTVYQVHHVKELLKPKEERVNQNNKLLKILRSKLYYTSVPGFNYSVSILSGVIVGIMFVYVLAVTTFEVYFYIVKGLKAYTSLLKNMESSARYDDLAEFLLKNNSANATALIHHIIEEIDYWVDSTAAALYIAVISSLLLTSLSLVMTLKNYRRHLLYIYKGVYKAIPSFQHTSPRSLVVSSTKYVGYQFGYAAWGFIFQSVVILLLTITLTVLIILVIRYKLTQILIWLLKKFGPVVLYLILLLLSQHLVVHFFLLQRDEHGNRVLAINNRRIFFNFQYFMIFANAPLGFFSCLLRILKAVIFGLWILPRLDVSTLNRQFERFDAGFGSYVALLKVENAQTNPVLVVFVNLLLESIRKLNFTIEKGAYKPWTIPEAKEAFPYRAPASWKRARNRWCTLLTLHNNPGLRMWRKNAIIIVNEGSLSDGAGSKSSDKEKSDETYLYYSNSSTTDSELSAPDGRVDEKTRLDWHTEFRINPVFIDDDELRLKTEKLIDDRDAYCI